MIYEIIIRGCCDSTKCKIELTPEEIKGVITLAEASSDVFLRDGMSYPSIEDIKVHDNEGTTWTLWNLDTYRNDRRGT